MDLWVYGPINFMPGLKNMQGCCWVSSVSFKLGMNHSGNCEGHILNQIISVTISGQGPSNWNSNGSPLEWCPHSPRNTKLGRILLVCSWRWYGMWHPRWSCVSSVSTGWSCENAVLQVISAWPFMVCSVQNSSSYMIVLLLTQQTQCHRGEKVYSTLFIWSSL
jgi:hypothetical protein